MTKLSAKTRKEIGKGISQIRKEEKIPAVCYGAEIKNAPISVDYKEFMNVLRETEGSSLFDLDIDGKTFPVIIKEIQRDPVSGSVVHVDFYQVPMNKKIEATVPLIFEGEAPAVKNFGGTLIKDLQSIDIKVLPNLIPKHIVINVGKLENIGDEILVGSIDFPEGAEILRNKKDVIAYISAVTSVEEELEKPIEAEVKEEEKPREPEATEETENTEK
ncbi:MAG: 50S ribosomal protein L25 [bacterium]|nr:50S ribosomal protein L25 [bacterium]